jgi:hypothetical protein
MTILLFAYSASPELRDWTFVRSVGGLRYGTPVRQADGQVLLPLEADVSGLQSFTERPTTLNSGIVCKGWRSTIHGREIRITLDAGIAGIEGKNARCPSAVSLGKLEPGHFTLVYGNRDQTTHDLGAIDIP